MRILSDQGRKIFSKIFSKGKDDYIYYIETNKIPIAKEIKTVKLLYVNYILIKKKNKAYIRRNWQVKGQNHLQNLWKIKGVVFNPYLASETNLKLQSSKKRAILTLGANLRHGPGLYHGQSPHLDPWPGRVGLNPSQRWGIGGAGAKAPGEGVWTQSLRANSACHPSPKEWEMKMAHGLWRNLSNSREMLVSIYQAGWAWREARAPAQVSALLFPPQGRAGGCTVALPTQSNVAAPPAQIQETPWEWLGTWLKDLYG